MAFFLWKKKGMKDLMPPSHFLQKNNPKFARKLDIYIPQRQVNWSWDDF